MAYDVLDGYNMNLEKVDKYLENVDFYFKRSFNKEENKKMCNGNKIYPLGMNYHATTKNNPLDHKKTILKIKDVLRKILGKNVEKNMI